MCACSRLAVPRNHPPVLDYVKRITKDSPRTVVTVFIPEYVVGHWWEGILPQSERTAAQGRLLFEPNVMVTSRSIVAIEFVRATEDVAAPVGAGRCQTGIWIESADTDQVRPPTAAAAWRAGRRPSGVRALRAAGRDGAAPGRRSTRILLARRSGGRSWNPRPSASNRCARSPASTVRAAATWRSQIPSRCARSRARWWPISCSASAGSGPARPSPSARQATGWRTFCVGSVPTAAARLPPLPQR